MRSDVGHYEFEGPGFAGTLVPFDDQQWAALQEQWQTTHEGEELPLSNVACGVATLAERDLVDLEDHELRASVRWLKQLSDQVHAQWLRRVAEIDRRGAQGGARSTPDMLAAELGLTKGEARAETDTALALRALPQTAQGLADGTVRLSQAKEAARALADARRVQGEGGCGDLAGVIDQTTAAAGTSVDRGLLREQLDAATGADQRDAVRDRELRAYAKRNLWMADRPDRDGLTRIEGDLSAPVAAAMRTAIDALARKSSVEDPRDLRQRRHDALGEMSGSYLDHGEGPDVGGVKPHVLLITNPDALHDRPDAEPSRLDGVGVVSAHTARQICCDADVTVVVKRNHEVLDAWRLRRDPSPRQRWAVIARDVRCIGCGARASRCQVHHIDWWRNGGPTNIDNLCLLCAGCHTNVHHFGWTVQRQPDGSYRAIPPPRSP